MAKRLQRSRRKGSRLPSDAVVVSRPTKWGNPHPLNVGRHEAVRRFRTDLLAGRLPVGVHEVRAELRGRDLACYCPLDLPCHADVLLRVANSETEADSSRDVLSRRTGQAGTRPMSGAVTDQRVGCSGSPTTSPVTPDGSPSEGTGDSSSGSSSSPCSAIAARSPGPGEEENVSTPSSASSEPP